jgi:hypothetical protein
VGAREIRDGSMAVTGLRTRSMNMPKWKRGAHPTYPT